MINDTTKRFSRSLNEAFGPHTSNRIDSDEPKTPAHEIVLYVVCFVAAILLVVVL